MVKLTRCDLSEEYYQTLSPFLVFRIAVLLILIGTLLLAQTHLRFSTRNMKIETVKIQKEYTELYNQQLALTVEVEEKQRFDTDLREYAQGELGLYECSIENIASATVPAKTVARWKALERQMAAPARANQRDDWGVAEFGRRILSWSTPAVGQGTGEE